MTRVLVLLAALVSATFTPALAQSIKLYKVDKFTAADSVRAMATTGTLGPVGWTMGRPTAGDTLGWINPLAGAVTDVTGVSPISVNCITGACAVSVGQINLTNKVTGILPPANGGTGNGFFSVSGVSGSMKTYTFPNVSGTVALLGEAQTFSGTKSFSVPINANAGVNFTSGSLIHYDVNALRFSVGTEVMSLRDGMVDIDGRLAVTAPAAFSDSVLLGGSTKVQSLSGSGTKLVLADHGGVLTPGGSDTATVLGNYTFSGQVRTTGLLWGENAGLGNVGTGVYAVVANGDKLGFFKSAGVDQQTVSNSCSTMPNPVTATASFMSCLQSYINGIQYYGLIVPQ